MASPPLTRSNSHARLAHAAHENAAKPPGFVELLDSLVRAHNVEVQNAYERAFMSAAVVGSAGPSTPVQEVSERGSQLLSARAGQTAAAPVRTGRAEPGRFDSGQVAPQSARGDAADLVEFSSENADRSAWSSSVVPAPNKNFSRVNSKGSPALHLSEKGRSSSDNLWERTGSTPCNTGPCDESGRGSSRSSTQNLQGIDGDSHSVSAFTQCMSAEDKRRNLQTLLEQKKRDKPLAERVVRHTLFDLCMACLVGINAIMIGVEIDDRALMDYNIDPMVFLAVEVVFSVIFSLELFLRFYIDWGRLFQPHREGSWLLMDMTLVTLSWVDVAFTSLFQESLTKSVDKLLIQFMRMMRLVRILRILRVVRFLTQVRSLIFMIAGSMLSLFWLFIILGGVMYAFALVLTSGGSDLLEEGSLNAQEHAVVEDEFGTVLRTILTLFECITNGISWGEVGKRTYKMGAIYFIVFLWYLFFTTFSILNIVTGVFVDSAIQLAEHDRSAAVEKVARARARLQKSLGELIKEMDADNNGCISVEEWELAMMNPNIKGQLEAMGIAHHETLELFHMLDASGDGEVQVDEFLDGIARVKGGARSLDLHKVMKHTKQILSLLDPHMEEDEGSSMSDLGRLSTRDSMRDSVRAMRNSVTF